LRGIYAQPAVQKIKVLGGEIYISGGIRTFSHQVKLENTKEVSLIDPLTNRRRLTGEKVGGWQAYLRTPDGSPYLTLLLQVSFFNWTSFKDR
jgi:hypothetical protein